MPFTASRQIYSYSIKDTDLVLDGGDAEYIFRVRDAPIEHEPRERLIRGGPDALSVSELLALMLDGEASEEETLVLSSRILKDYGERSIAHQTNPMLLVQELGIPLVKACQIVACFELGRRFFQTNSRGSVTIRTARQAFEYLKDMRDLPKEQLRGIYVNSRHRVVHDEVISIGSIAANIVHPREVFQPAFEHGAVALLVAHNHPSGDPQPSAEDIRITRQLMDAGKILGIDFLDHLIVAPHKFVSIVSLLGLR
ncbi:MAG: DNA repair protein RadC [Candidatus Sungbacteria bacterium]|nr:DNA repair protein RadC [Candidatus Sungbacteria bacterium]